MERKIEEKILWINSANMLSGTTSNFYYNIGNILYVDNYKKNYLLFLLPYYWNQSIKFFLLFFFPLLLIIICYIL